MAATKCQKFQSLTNNLKYAVTMCSSNHGHISCVCYVLVFRLFKRFNYPLNDFIAEELAVLLG